MAGSSNYKMLIQTELDIKTGLAKARVEAAKQSLTVGLKFNIGETGKVVSDISQIEQRFKEIKATTDQLATMSAKKNPLGVIDQYTLEYMDKYSNKYTEVYRLVSETDAKTKKITTSWEMTSKVMDGAAARQKEILNSKIAESKVLSDQQKQLAKNADEMGRMAQKADEFIAKSKNMQQTPAVQLAVGKAQEIKVAVSEGDISKVRRLNDEFKTMQAGLQGVKGGLRSWSDAMGNALKQTVSYAVSTGLLYSAMSQVREGIQYVVDLNKEMTDIQLVTGENDAQVAKLAESYNDLGKEMAVSTLEIARGSLEFIRQGKSAEDTATLIRNSTMMSKLGNMEAAESSEALTSIMNGFKLSAQETGDVVDKLVAIKSVATHSDMWTKYFLGTNVYLCYNN